MKTRQLSNLFKPRAKLVMGMLKARSELQTFYIIMIFFELL